MKLQIERNGQVFDAPVVPELSPRANFGEIGVKLTPNAEINQKCG